MKHSPFLAWSLAFVLAVAGAAAVVSCGSSGTSQDPPPPSLAVSGFGVLSPTVAVSAQPSKADLAAARAAGYGTVVNFRSPGESGELPDEAAVVEALGMRYVTIPVSGHDVDAGHVDRLAAALDAAAGSPVLLHCRSGTRARLVWDAWRARQDAPAPR